MLCRVQRENCFMGQLVLSLSKLQLDQATRQTKIQQMLKVYAHYYTIRNVSPSFHLGLCVLGCDGDQEPMFQ